jgi:hypothetical protein
MTNATQSEWLKVMLEEIDRKRDEAELAHREGELRAAERAVAPSPSKSGRSGSAAQPAQSRQRRSSRP